MSWWRTRAALGLAPIVAPAVVLVPLGAALGPYGLNLLSPSIQAALDPVMSLAFAALGVFAGMAIDFRNGEERRHLLAATVEAGVTAATVAATVGMLLVIWGVPAAGSRVAIALGFAAAASAGAGFTRRPGGDDDVARVAELDDAVVIVLGGVALAVGDLSVASVAWNLGGALAVGAAFGGAGWLLFEHAASPAERGVFVLGTLALIGGAAVYLGWSPLLVGSVAGAVWRWAPGRADEIIRDDLAKLQHPMIALLLLVAGAAFGGRLAVWLFVPFVVFRLTGKLVGGWAAAALLRDVSPTELGARLLPCGALAIALAVNFRQLSSDPAAAAVVGAVAAASVVFEIAGSMVAADVG